MELSIGTWWVLPMILFMGCAILLFFFFFTFVYVRPQRPEGALYESLVFQMSASRLMWVLRSEVGPLIEQ